MSAVEAPRGLLIHHYRWDENGTITMANIITPTNANYPAIDSSLAQVAGQSIAAGQVQDEKLLNEVGLMIRAYDPCLSCWTHAFSSGPAISIEVINARGKKGFCRTCA